ncbi:hypothetical protein [Oleidesulfovibrio sp.]|uniref:phage nozzle protein n=1 Tax=Oleidesulfovibrio sp. TaxID=2909707 RepID=UPI003A881162
MSRITLTRNSFNGGELSPLLSARVDQQRYSSGCKTLRNMTVYPHGAAMRRPGMRHLGMGLQASGASAGGIRLIPFVFSQEQAYVLELGEGSMRIWKDDGLVLDENGKPVTVETPWRGEALQSLQYCQSADVMYLVCRQAAPRKLARYAHADWRLSGLTFGAGIPAPQGLTASATGTAERQYRYVVTAVAKEGGEEGLPSEVVTVTGASSLNVRDLVRLRWQPVDGAETYNIYKSVSGSDSFGYIGKSGAGEVFEDRGADPDFGQGPPKFCNPFEKEGQWPACVQFYQQRLCFAGSDEKPQTIWCSQSANYESMNVSSPLRDDDAVTVTIAADRVNRIRWMMPARRLLVGTAGGEWQLSGSGDRPLTPVDVQLRRDTMHGSADLMPLVIGQSILFVQRDGRSVREFRYSLESDGYDAADMTILAEHIMRGHRIVSWCYQQSPASVVWCALSDGTLAAMTFLREHEVVGWHRHETDGVVEAVTCIPGASGDEVWLSVCRTRVCTLPDGTHGEETIRSIERLEAVMRGADAAEAFFVDSGLSREGEPVTTVGGLDHLEGRTVQILCDGWVHPPRIVQNGCILLDTPASRIHAGLGYVSELVPTAFETMTGDGSSQGRTRRVSRVRVALHESMGLKAGTEGTPLSEVLFRMASDKAGQALPLFSGERDIAVESRHNGQTHVVLRQEDPLPLTVLSITAQLEFGEW